MPHKGLQSHAPEKKKQPKTQERVDQDTEARQKREGQAAVREREKLASKQGISSRKAARQLAQGGIEQDATFAEGEAQREVASQQLEQAGAFEQVRDQEVDFSVKSPNIPLAGPSVAAVVDVLRNPSSILAEAERAGLLKGIVKDVGGPFVAPTDETMREAALRQISNREFKKGLTAGETFGTFIEGIPGVGTLAKKFASGLTELPSENVQTILNRINSERERAAIQTSSVRTGFGDPYSHLEMARLMEENMAAAKGRMFALIRSSPSLRADPDAINEIQEKILRADERIRDYRQAASIRLTAELTGTALIPTDEQIFQRLLEDNKR